MFDSNKLRVVLHAALVAVFVPFAAFAYTVTYDCGDGTGTPPASATVADGESFTPVMILKDSCARIGYILSGWAVSDTGDIKRGTFTWEYTEDKTLTAQWVEFEPKFTITTTNMAAGDIFKYWQGADGLFYVDWGDGTLQTINYKKVIPHTYSDSGVHTIRFGGLATNYVANHTNNTPGVVSFGIKATGYNGTTAHAGTPLYVAGISGSLGAIYPSLSNGLQPRFVSTFNGCTNLTGTIPETLFTGVTGSASDNTNNSAMFGYTFTDCSNLQGPIPDRLFGNLNAVPGMGMFSNTFSGCANLDGEIPKDLFAGVTGSPRAGLFASTFSGCAGLSGSIPKELFAGISGNASVATGDVYTISHSNGSSTTYRDTAAGAFMSTFNGCSGLTGPIPVELFTGITGVAAALFNGTFNGCSGLSGEIPGELFAGITGSAPYLFDSTFYLCSGLTGPIPEDLFAGVTGAADRLFNGVFAGCSGLTGPIPENLFGRVVNGTFSGITGNATRLFAGAFYKCHGLTSIPENLFGRVVNGTYQGVTGAAEQMFARTFQNMCELESIPENLFAGVSGSAKGLFQLTFSMSACGVDDVAENHLTGYVHPALFAGIDADADDIFANTFKDSSMYTTCPCGTHESTTAWGISFVDTRAVCEEGLKSNEHYYTGDNDETACTTDCSFATQLKTGTGVSHPLLSEQVTVPSMVFQVDDTKCYVPLESGAGDFNLKWGNNLYHAGDLDVVN